jgi:hypothetical protein
VKREKKRREQQKNSPVISRVTQKRSTDVQLLDEQWNDAPTDNRENCKNAVCPDDEDAVGCGGADPNDVVLRRKPVTTS